MNKSKIVNTNNLKCTYIKIHVQNNKISINKLKNLIGICHCKYSNFFVITLFIIKTSFVVFEKLFIFIGINVF